jgi:uncharacterized protein (TIGR02231 family)
MGEEPIPFEAPVVEVMLLEDRAQVVRRGRMTLPPGSARIRVQNVSPVISDRTLSVRVLPPAKVQVGSARVVRFQKAVQAERPVEVRELEEALEKSRDEADALGQEDLLIGGRLEGLDRFEKLLLEDVEQDAAWDRGPGQETGDQLDRIQEESAALQAKRAAVTIAMERQQEDVRDLERRLARARNPSTAVGANLDADLHADGGGPCEIEISYMVPGACWRPWHTATRMPGEKLEILFRSDACVWQNTGEDWNGVQLLFSTARISLGVEPPGLESDVIETRPKPAALKVAAREQTVQTTGLGAAVEETVDVPGVDDGGDVFAVRSVSRADIPSDGRPYRVCYGNFRAEAESQRVVFPELAPAVIRKTVQANTGSMPLLAGPVDLVAEGGFAGRTRVKLVAPNERFALGWGPDGAIRVHREVEQVDEETGLMGNMLTTRYFVTLRLSSIGAEERELEATERVPVSEIEQVEIAVDRKLTTQAKTPDENGFVRWDVRLPPFSREVLRLVYTIRKKKEVTGI